MPLKEYDEIKLRDEYQETLGDRQAIETDRNRTPGKDEVAAYIVNNVLHRWPMHASDIADEVEWSRQHVSNTLSDYFEGVDDDSTDQGNRQVDRSQTDSQPFTATPNQQSSSVTTTGTEMPQAVWVKVNGSYEQVSIEIPSDVESRSSYVKGYLAGLDAL